MKPTLSHPAISDPKAVVAVYNTHSEAEAGVRELQKAGFDTKKLAYGTAAEVARGKDILKTTKPAQLDEHVLGSARAAAA